MKRGRLIDEPIQDQSVEALGALEEPAQVLGAAAAQREGPNATGEPAVLVRRRPDHRHTRRRAEAPELERDTGRVGPMVHVTSGDRRLVCARGDRLAAHATEQALRIPELLSLVSS